MMQESTVTPAVYRNAHRESDRPVLQSMLRGAKHKCPACGVGALYWRFLKVSDTCPHCGEELHHHRADDAPPYFTVVIVGHIVVALVLFVFQAIVAWFISRFRIATPTSPRSEILSRNLM